MNEEMLRGLTSRRSNRAFAPEQITDEELHKVLAAGMNAPTAKNGQSPIIIAVQNPDEVAAVNALNAKFTLNADPYYGAPTILLVLVPRTFPLGDLDGAAVLTNLCNGAYAARYVAKNIVAAGLAHRCQVQLAYALGVAEPVSVNVTTFGTGTVSDEALEKAVKKVFDLRPTAIIRDLDLRKPIYRRLAAYGHMGREDLGVAWEKTDRTEKLKKAVQG